MKLLKISMLITFLGIFLLLTISNFYEPKLINIEEIKSNHLNKIIKIQGKIIQEKNYNDFQIITIQDNTKKINVLLNKPINLNNKTLIITGKVIQYKSELQIQAEKIYNNYSTSI
jgi:RecJ-like exonuclease